MKQTVITAALVVLFSGTGCAPADDGRETAAPSAAPAAANAPAENVPITLDYTLVGAPIVGESVAVNLEIRSPAADQPVRVTYRSAEQGDMSFPESQASETTLPGLSNGTVRRHQFALIPQREGRIYVVVAAELDSEHGVTMKSISIPVQVSRADEGEATGDE